MKCPNCNRVYTRVVDSRQDDEAGTVRRRRQCAGCTQRFSTIEAVVPEQTPEDRLKNLQGSTKKGSYERRSSKVAGGFDDRGDFVPLPSQTARNEPVVQVWSPPIDETLDEKKARLRAAREARG